TWLLVRMTPLGSTMKPEPKPSCGPRSGISRPRRSNSSKNRRNSSGTWSSTRGRTRDAAGLAGLTLTSLLTTARNNRLPTSRYDVISLGTTGAAGCWPCDQAPVIKDPAIAPRTRNAKAIDHCAVRFMIGAPPLLLARATPGGAQTNPRVGKMMESRLRKSRSGSAPPPPPQAWPHEKFIDARQAGPGNDPKAAAGRLPQPPRYHTQQLDIKSDRPRRIF